MILDSLQRIAEENKKKADRPYLRNLLKERLELYTLNFIFTSVYAKDFLFKGGACFLRKKFLVPRAGI